jgi:hypothetical protein
MKYSSNLAFAAVSLSGYSIAAIAILLIVGSAIYFMRRFEHQFISDVKLALKTSSKQSTRLIKTEDLKHLPEPVRAYLVHAGVVGKPLVQNFYLMFDGDMRDKGKDWFSFTSRQYDVIDPGTRLFFMKAKMFGMTVPGYHAYGNGKASMDIKLLGIIPVVSHHEKELFKTESVTFLNDVCLFAPSALIGPQFQWEKRDALSATVIYRTGEISVRATLYFNTSHELINFESDDRMAVANKTTYRFSTPASNYKTINGYTLPTYGETIWHYPDGLFTYGKFRLKEVMYNVEPPK